MPSCRLRCTVSGGLEDFAETELSCLFGLNDNRSCDENNGNDQQIQVVWHHRGHVGSQLDVVFQQPQNQLIHESMLLLITKSRFVDNVSLQILSTQLKMELAGEGLLEWITEQCLNLDPSMLQFALDTWSLWSDQLDQVMPLSTRQLDGALIPFPTANQEDNQLPQASSIQTETFRVNTIYTRPWVAKAVVQTFQELVFRQLDNGDKILWLDAGAGSGSLLQHLPQHASIGVDLDPRHESIHQRDFFEVSTPWLQSIFPDFEHLCILSNPPFVQGSRGDYGIIGQFLQHAIKLRARHMGLIVPVKFVHVWKSFGLPIQLLYRMHLPKDSFYDPSTTDTKHIHCYLLVYDFQPSLPVVDKQQQNQSLRDTNRPTIHIVSQRDKSLHSQISTAQLTSAVVNGLGRAGVSLGSSKHSACTLKAKLTTTLELYLELNSKRPLSLANSFSNSIPNHSLGFMTKSVKPPVALAMHESYRGNIHPLEPSDSVSNSESTKEQPTVVVDLMCGEGTIEYESLVTTSINNMHKLPSTFFLVGDKNAEALYQVANNTSLLPPGPKMDFVQWDAQRLPLRREIADVILGDLPFAGSNKKQHQVPSTSLQSHKTQEPPTNYQKVLAESARVLPALGQAIFVSPDAKALVHAAKKYWGLLDERLQSKINIGGLMGRMVRLQRKNSRWKDLNLLLLEETDVDSSQEILKRARRACRHYFLDDLCNLQQISGEQDDHAAGYKYQELIRRVFRKEEYRHPDGSTSHCYRLCFDPMVSNIHAKTLESCIRQNLQENPIHGTRI